MKSAANLTDAGFDFSLPEFSGGRGFLHWTPEGEEGDGRHWSTLDGQSRELARLQESVAWWIPPCGFAYAMTDNNAQVVITSASSPYVVGNGSTGNFTV